MSIVRRIREIIEPYINLPLDSYCMTKVLTHLLTRESIPHAAYIGTIRVRDDDSLMPHSWICLGSGQIVDFRSGTWLQDDPSIAHGVFHPDESSLVYEGVDVDLSVSQVLFDVLTRKAE